MIITAYTDGSCNNKTRQGEIGVYIKYNDKEEFLSKGFKDTTISRMEMTAVLYCLRKISQNVNVRLFIYSDSKFVVNAFNKGWIKKWQINNFENIKNKDLWIDILNEIKNKPLLKLKIEHIRGHQKNIDNINVYENNVADLLANYKNFL